LDAYLFKSELVAIITQFGILGSTTDVLPAVAINCRQKPDAIEFAIAQKDGLGIQDDALANYLDEWLARDYSALGYSVVRVPVLPPQERLAFILGRLSEQGLI
jgi:hypothetical protein